MAALQATVGAAGVLVKQLDHATSSALPVFPARMGRRHHAAVPASRRRGHVLCRPARASLAEAEKQQTLSGEEGVRPDDVKDDVPIPTIRIDNEHDPFATIVIITYGDRLGELLDTVASLKNLGLNVRRAKVGVHERTGDYRHKFYLTEAATSEKITKSKRLEEIRLSILNNLLLYHPESGEELAWGLRARKTDSSALMPLGTRSNRAVETIITVDGEDDDAYSTLYIKTRDRPGLLVEIVSVLKDINVNVNSAEIDTEGVNVVNTFYVTYHGEPLPPPMVQLVTNALQYYLSLNEVDKDESY